MKRKKGSGGVDELSLEDIQVYGEKKFLNELYIELKEKRYLN
ncbi:MULTISPECIES: hypothetical protein [Bacillaceae]|nr:MULTISPECIES: hypothetical protein [Bacillaceae]